MAKIFLTTLKPYIDYQKGVATMKKISALLFALALFLLVSGCSGNTNTSKPDSTPDTAADSNETTSSEITLLEGDSHKYDKFSITAPEGWETMDVQGGIQLYKMSGEIIEVHFRGENQTEDHAKQQAESLASQYSGTTPTETELLGKTFWTTTFTASGVEQTSYLRMEDGVLLSIKCAKGNYETPEYAAIIESIVFN